MLRAVILLRLDIELALCTAPPIHAWTRSRQDDLLPVSAVCLPELGGVRTYRKRNLGKRFVLLPVRALEVRVGTKEVVNARWAVSHVVIGFARRVIELIMLTWTGQRCHFVVDAGIRRDVLLRRVAYSQIHYLQHLTSSVLFVIELFTWNVVIVSFSYLFTRR